jgi:hypothetical protein
VDADLDAEGVWRGKDERQPGERVKHTGLRVGEVRLAAADIRVPERPAMPGDD